MTEFWMALPFTGLGFVLLGALLWRLREQR